VRVRAGVLSAGDYVRLQGRRVMLTDFEECSDRPGYVLVRGNYFRPPDFVNRVHISAIMRDTAMITRYEQLGYSR
jgi:hypothetical protein